MEIAAVVISIMAFLLSIIQFVKESSRQKKEATLIAYNELQNEVFSELNLIFIKKADNLKELKEGDEAWENLTVFLAKIERFSVGINTGIYSIVILNRLGGGYLIRIFETLKPIIYKKRSNKVSSGKHYDEFEKVVNRLKKMRKNEYSKR